MMPEKPIRAWEKEPEIMDRLFFERQKPRIMLIQGPNNIPVDKFLADKLLVKINLENERVQQAMNSARLTWDKPLNKWFNIFEEEITPEKARREITKAFVYYLDPFGTLREKNPDIGIPANIGYTDLERFLE